MTTSVYKLRNEHGITQKTMNIISSMLSRHEIEFQLSVISMIIKPFEGQEYMKHSKARVFLVEDVIEALVKPVPRKYTVSTFQANIDRQNRDDAFHELTQILKKEES